MKFIARDKIEFEYLQDLVKDYPEAFKERIESVEFEDADEALNEATIIITLDILTNVNSPEIHLPKNIKHLNVKESEFSALSDGRVAIIGKFIKWQKINFIFDDFEI